MVKNATQITYNKQTLSLLKEFSPICDSIILAKESNNDELIISQDNNTLGFILKAPKDHFGFINEEEIAFHSYSEFYNLLTVFEDANLYQTDNNAYLIIEDKNNQKTKIQYLLTEPSILEAGPLEVPFGETDASMKLDSNTMIKISKMIGLIKAEKIKIEVSEKNIHMSFYKDECDNTFEQTFTNEINSKEEFQYIISAEIFTNTPKNDYIVDFKSCGMVRLSAESEQRTVEIFTGEIIK